MQRQTDAGLRLKDETSDEVPEVFFLYSKRGVQELRGKDRKGRIQIQELSSQG